MVGQPHRNFMKMASWSSVSEHLVNPIGMSDQLKWNNQATTTDKIIMIKSVKTANKIILKVFYSASSINEDIIARNINEILLNKSCSLSIKVVDDKYASILLSFDISS